MKVLLPSKTSLHFQPFSVFQNDAIKSVPL